MKSQNLSAKLTSISSLGLVQLEFSDSMLDTFDMSLLNQTSMDLYIRPALSRHKSNDFDPASVALTWQVVSFKDTLMQVQLNFTNPIAISPLPTFDEIVFNITDPSLLYSPTLKAYLHEDYWGFIFQS